jgi:DNA-binding IscR family transcriptional regulator
VATQVWRKLRDDIVTSLSSFTLSALAREARDLGQGAENYAI